MVETLAPKGCKPRGTHKLYAAAYLPLVIPSWHKKKPGIISALMHAVTIRFGWLLDLKSYE